MKTVLISGNKGFIGSYIEASLKTQYNIIGLARNDGFDITDFSSLKNIGKPGEKVDIIIHAAAVASDDYEHSFISNVIGTLNLCKYANEQGVKHFVLLSTIFAIEKEDNDYFNTYGQTKKMAEDVAMAYCKEHGITLTILRLAQVYDDARLAQKGQAMLYYFLDNIKQKSEICLFGRSNPLRNYIHIDYFCNVLKEILTEKRVMTWNILEEKNHSISEIAYMLFDILKKQPNITYLREKENIPSVHIPDTNIYKSTTISSISLYEGLKRILNHDK